MSGKDSTQRTERERDDRKGHHQKPHAHHIRNVPVRNSLVDDLGHQKRNDSLHDDLANHGHGTKHGEDLELGLHPRKKF